MSTGVLWSGLAVFLYLFFRDYLPPNQRVHIPFDLDGFHYPLLDYGFQAIAQGRFPEWDATTYCGSSYVANPQAAFFYPGSWLLFIVNAGRSHLHFRSIELFIFAHLGLAFALCFGWLRAKGLHWVACLMAAGCYAFGGAALEQMQHLGVIVAIAWMPLALWGIDQQRYDWVVAASALAFLGGYTPAWFAIAACLPLYSLGIRWQSAAAATASIVASLGVAAVQLLPSIEAARFRAPEFLYGGGVSPWEWLTAVLVPDLGKPELAHLYLGSAGLLGLLAAFWRIRMVKPLLLLLAGAVVLGNNPLGAVSGVLPYLGRLAEICRDYYFFLPLSVSLAGLAAVGLDRLLQRRWPPVPSLAAAIPAIAWSCWHLWREPASGWVSLISPITGVAVILLLIATFEKQKSLTIGLLILIAGVDLRTYGILRFHNSAPGDSSLVRRNVLAGGFEEIAIRELERNRGFRLALDVGAPFPTALRHIGLTTPQGFDPLLPEQYKKEIEKYITFRTNREFEIDPKQSDLLDLVGVRYFVTSDGSPNLAFARTNFRPLDSGLTYTKVFERPKYAPPFGWEHDRSSPATILARWAPEERHFQVHSKTGGRFVLVEQFHPGWEARVDGHPVRIERWHGAFQAISVPGGEHRIEFQFRSMSLRFGAAISLATLAGLALFFRVRLR